MNTFADSDSKADFMRSGDPEKQIFFERYRRRIMNEYVVNEFVLVNDNDDDTFKTLPTKLGW